MDELREIWPLAVIAGLLGAIWLEVNAVWKRLGEISIRLKDAAYQREKQHEERQNVLVNIDLNTGVAKSYLEDIYNDRRKGGDG